MAAATRLEERFLAVLRRHPRLIPPGSRVLVAFSGGADSTALLALLLQARDAFGLHVAAAHFDHAQRAGSAADAEEAIRRARALGAPCRLGRARPGPARGQAELRTARYAFLRREADAWGAERVATGHQADDQAETVLLRILRGTGLRGLGGIPARRGPFVRPLLGFRHRELVAWLEGRGIPWLDDPSNLDTRWSRARVRGELLPALERAVGPEVRRRLLAVAAAARRAERSLEAAAGAALEACVAAGGRREEGEEAPAWGRPLERGALLCQPVELRARILRRLGRDAGVRLTRGGTRAGVEFISRGRSGSRVDLGGGLVLAREFDLLVVRRGGDSAAEDRELLIPGPEAGEGHLVVGGRTLRARWGRAAASPPSPRRVALPVAGGHFPLRLRGWRPGDRIRLGGGTRKLKRLFGERRVPVARRGRIPVLADAAGRVLWVPEVAVAREIEGSGETGEAFVIELSE